MAFNRLLSMVEAIFTVHEDDIDCEACDAEMAHLAELIEAGEDPALLLPAVQKHLDMCADCGEEFDALLLIVRAEHAGLLTGVETPED